MNLFFIFGCLLKKLTKETQLFFILIYFNNLCYLIDASTIVFRSNPTILNSENYKGKYVMFYSNKIIFYDRVQISGCLPPLTSQTKQIIKFKAIITFSNKTLISKNLFAKITNNLLPCSSNSVQKLNFKKCAFCIII